MPSGPCDSPEELPHKRVGELNSSSAGPDFDDAALPQHADVLGDAAAGMTSW